MFGGQCVEVFGEGQRDRGDIFREMGQERFLIKRLELPGGNPPPEIREGGGEGTTAWTGWQDTPAPRAEWSPHAGAHQVGSLSGTGRG